MCIRDSIEWGLYNAFKGGTPCAATTNFDLPELGMHVTVSCRSATYGEGLADATTPQARRVYTIDAVACNASACPDAARAVTPFYVERRRQVQATDG